jgi:hypothetical protein
MFLPCHRLFILRASWKKNEQKEERRRKWRVQSWSNTTIKPDLSVNTLKSVRLQLCEYRKVLNTIIEKAAFPWQRRAYMKGRRNLWQLNGKEEKMQQGNKHDSEIQIRTKQLENT